MITRALAKHKTGLAAAAALGLTWVTFWRRAQELGIELRPIEKRVLREALDEHGDVNVVAQEVGMPLAELCALLRRYDVRPGRNQFRRDWNRTGGDVEQLANRFGLTIAECQSLAKTYRVGPDAEMIQKALKEYPSFKQASRALGLPRATFERRLNELGIPNPFRGTRGK